MIHQDILSLMDEILRLQKKRCFLVIAIYLPSSCVDTVKESLTKDSIRPHSVGRYCNVPIYELDAMKLHDEWDIQEHGIAYYGIINMDSVD